MQILLVLKKRHVVYSLEFLCMIPCSKTSSEMTVLRVDRRAWRPRPVNQSQRRVIQPRPSLVTPDLLFNATSSRPRVTAAPRRLPWRSPHARSSSARLQGYPLPGRQVRDAATPRYQHQINRRTRNVSLHPSKPREANPVNGILTII